MNKIIPFSIPYHSTANSISSLSQECERLRFRMETARDFEAQRAHHADLEAKMLTLSRLTPESPQGAVAYSQAAIGQLECMIAAWEHQPTPAEALLLTMLDQLHAYLRHPPALTI